GAGDDVLDFRKVLCTVEVHGGIGNDTIYLSDGANSIADGGDGDDKIVASSATTAINAYLYGGNGSDKFTAGTTSIHIYGESHMDVGGETTAGAGDTCADVIQA